MFREVLPNVADESWKEIPYLRVSAYVCMYCMYVCIVCMYVLYVCMYVCMYVFMYIYVILTLELLDIFM